MSLLDVCVLTMAMGVLAGFLLSSNDQDRSHRFPPIASRPGDDLSNIAGEYYQGVRPGMSLSLSVLPDGRYSFVWSGCTGVHHRESGYVSSTDGSYVLSPLGTVVPRIDHHFLLVPWQSRRYLVPPEKMQEFCDAIIKGYEPRNEYPGAFYLSVPFDQADGLPELPEAWASYLRENLVLGRITEVRNDGLVRVDFGTERGIQEGTILTVRGNRRFHDRCLRVVSADGGTCRAQDYFPDRHEEPLELGREVIAEWLAEARDDQ